MSNHPCVLAGQCRARLFALVIFACFIIPATALAHNPCAGHHQEQLRRGAHGRMAGARKLQKEIEVTLKKVQEGVEEFDEIWKKVWHAGERGE